MIAHVVLYERKPDLSREDAERFIRAIERASTEIPPVRAMRIGRRHSIGAGYEALAGDGYSHFALFEFDDEAGLRAYLEHPAHVALAALFWSCAVRMIALDYELAGDDVGSDLRSWNA